ncbi:MAG: rhodanese-like domain-containing protein [Acidobacteria bacterium]|nr:rhodanese-like domain-containing protein [Acidobacteriota bacterium]
MYQQVTLEEVTKLMRDEKAQLIEVLSHSEYEREHLPGSINLPLSELNSESVRRLDRERPVIVYCFDYQ